MIQSPHPSQAGILFLYKFPELQILYNDWLSITTITETESRRLQTSKLLLFIPPVYMKLYINMVKKKITFKNLKYIKG